MQPLQLQQQVRGILVLECTRLSRLLSFTTRSEIRYKRYEYSYTNYEHKSLLRQKTKNPNNKRIRTPKPFGHILQETDTAQRCVIPSQW